MTLQVLKEKGVEFIVAPYEADAQMAFLARNEYVHVVITEDSDMIAYRCPIVSLCPLIHRPYLLLMPLTTTCK